MIRMQWQAGHRHFAILAVALSALAAGSAAAQDQAATFEGKAVRIGKGTANTVVRTDATGAPVSIGVVFTDDMLDGLPVAAKGEVPDFPYTLAMPETGPKTVIDHVVINWESLGHPPPKIYDVPHFDFHFYLTSETAQKKVSFKSDQESGDPGQQPGAELLAAGYVVPPGTAVTGMGVHAVNLEAPEFNGQPFTATFIYGYHDKRLTFIEPMASLTYLKSQPNFSAPIPRPASYTVPGAYPSTYSIKYDAATKRYEVLLDDLK